MSDENQDDNQGELAFSGVAINARARRPRRTGLTYVRDAGLSMIGLEDLLQAAGNYMDILKLAAFSPRLQKRSLIADKVQRCQAEGVAVGLGGPILETAVLQGPETVLGYFREARELGIEYVEISRHLAVLSVRDLTNLTRAAKDEGLRPIAEVGVAYGISERDDVEINLNRLLDTMDACREAGAWKVLLESEGITENRCPEDRRWDVVAVVAGTLPLEDVMFEADDPEVWNRYIYDYGPDVNLMVDSTQVLRLEASRLGGWAQPQTVVRRVASFPYTSSGGPPAGEDGA